MGGATASHHYGDTIFLTRRQINGSNHCSFDQAGARRHRRRHDGRQEGSHRGRGDVARAKEIIRAKGIQAAGKREGRKAQEGTIASKVIESAEGQTGYAVELNSETDFVAKTPKFVEFAGSVLDDAVKAEASSVDEVSGSSLR